MYKRQGLDNAVVFFSVEENGSKVTHDVGEDPENLLQKDMMFTLEPGLYFLEEGIGIRIEDTLLVTEDGCEVLTADIPKTVEEIEAFMQS